ncbi:homoserine dehydrogenase (plasmid) [Variovorax paradoxus]|nr:homoserine dehydrogenase [Variovorax paradoxus]
MRNINVAITGFGGIGRKVAQLLLDRRDGYKSRYGFDVRVVGVCTSSAGIIRAEGLDKASLEDKTGYTSGLSGSSFIESVPADVLFEASPTDFYTGGAALFYIKSALARRMHIIAISKGALAFDFATIRDEAARQKVALKLSGAAGSAMPTIDLIHHNLAGCQVSSVAAIVTGTTNVILSAMMDQECSFEDALAEAQRLGIAESDPTLDTDGWDTACKIAILSNAAFGTAINVEKMPRQGIGGVTVADVRHWRSLGVMPRLVGHIDLVEGKYEASVRLDLCDESHPFARAHGRTKAVSVTTDLMGDLTIVGGGSSPYGTAAAALKDLEHVLRALEQSVV